MLSVYALNSIKVRKKPIYYNRWSRFIIFHSQIFESFKFLIALNLFFHGKYLQKNGPFLELAKNVHNLKTKPQKIDALLSNCISIIWYLEQTCKCFEKWGTDLRCFYWQLLHKFDWNINCKSNAKTMEHKNIAANWKWIIKMAKMLNQYKNKIAQNVILLFHQTMLGLVWLGIALASSETHTERENKVPWCCRKCYFYTFLSVWFG